MCPSGLSGIPLRSALLFWAPLAFLSVSAGRGCLWSLPCSAVVFCAPTGSLAGLCSGGVLLVSWVPLRSCLCGREESGNGPKDRRIKKLWPRLNLIWRSTLGFDDDADNVNEDENDDNDGELKRYVCAVLCCPGVARLSWGLLASPVLVSAPCALLRSPVPCSPGLFLALLRWPHLAFSSALLGSPVLCSPVLGPALSCARLCSPVLSCALLFLADRG